MRASLHIWIWSLSIFGIGNVAVADMAEEGLQMPTDGGFGGLFPVNPAFLRPKDMRFGALGLRSRRATTLDHTVEGGTKIASTVTNDFVGAGFGLDLGAGAGVAIEHVDQFRLVESLIDKRNVGKPIREVSKVQQTSVKLVVELTPELRAAIVMRLLQQQTLILGQPFLSPNQTTSYAPQMVGYGGGLSYSVADMGIGYAYYPPLHGKASVSGQEFIVSESGFIAVDAFARSGAFTIGVLGKSWLVEIDDLAAGGTAADNKTRISYYGLDPDQYLIRTQLAMVGLDYALTKDLALRLGGGQEQGRFDFRNLLVFDGVGVRQRGPDKITTSRGRVALHGIFSQLEVDLGYGSFSRSYKFADNEGGGTYKTIGQEMAAVVVVRF